MTRAAIGRRRDRTPGFPDCGVSSIANRIIDISADEITTHLTREELEAGLPEILESPADQGRLEAIVIRPRKRERISLTEGELSPAGGVHGDNWAVGCWKTLPDGSPHPDVQIAIMNSRCIAHIAREKERWELAGDQLYVDLDLSDENLPTGQRIRIGEDGAVLEITAEAHNGCRAFRDRFGIEALKFVNSPEGKKHHLRGIYAKVVEAGTVRVGDAVRKL